MQDAVTARSRLPDGRTRSLWLLAAVLSLLGSAVACFSWRTSLTGDVDPIRSRSPYVNTRPEVKYVEDSACIRCHAEIALTYRQHPMGRSLVPVAEARAATLTQENDPPQFDWHGFRYTIERPAGRFVHKESRQDATGRMIAQIEADVQYAVGSGRQAISYLIERDGFLFESPITWYAQGKRWGISPGYEKRNARFERPILSECLFCHANRVERVTSAVNRYRTPIFQGHAAIGCERCHGPGERHVRSPEVVEGIDVTIVNPAKLEPSLRDAVCEQCHLIGPTRVSRLGTRSEDFRPGLPFYRFWSIFVPAESDRENRFASHAEQMHASRCFRASEGGLGCISCHDPHVLPAPEEKVEYFRTRCLACHAERGCSLSASVRIQKRGRDDCIGCHMPRLSSSNNTHVVTTNHRVPRLETSARGSTGDASPPRRERTPFVNFHRDFLSARELASTERDRGIALCRVGGAAAAAEALPLLQAAVRARSDDLSALESLGEVLGSLGRPAEGVAAYKRALSQSSTRQTALEGAAFLSFKAGRYKDAIEFWKQAIAVNPWRSDYHAELAAAAFRLRDWHATAGACREALRLNPTLVPVRKWLVMCELQLGNREAAREELETLLRFDPPDREELLRRFSVLVTPRQE